MATLGVFGGSFNPPHQAHLIVAERVCDALALDKVLWIPAHIPPHKQHDPELAAPEHRLAMTRLAIQGNPHFELSDIELKRSGPSYTVDTLRTLKQEYPGTELFLILGGDSFQQFPTWHQPEEIVKYAHLVVYHRPGADFSKVPERFIKHAYFIRTPLLEISGTTIRKWVRTGHSIRYVVPDTVRLYIEEHHLYRIPPHDDSSS